MNNKTSEEGKELKVSIVIPAYNEEGNIKLVAETVIENLVDWEYELIFIDDGSSDGTLANIKKMSDENENIKFVSFSGNFGHQNALIAGLKHAAGDCVISLDADLQHPPEIIPEMLKKWRKGYEIVYTIRNDNKKVSLFKKYSSKWFYNFINKVSDIEIPRGAADFRLLDRSVVNIVNNIQERNIFLRGFLFSIGFRKYAIEYIPNKRYSGCSKYSLKKMISFAMNGITSFSIKPLRIATFIGFAMAVLAGVYTAYVLWTRVSENTVISGWASLMIVVLFLGGVQLMILGIIGEYLGKLFMESKKRPNYIIRERNN